MYKNLQVIPHILSWTEVWALTSHSNTFECSFSSMFRVIVLLEDERPLQSQISGRLKQIDILCN